MEINEQNFGENYHLITIANQNGTSLSASDLRARVVHFQTIIDNGKRKLVLGSDEAEGYLEKDPYIGASTGRMAGRITNGTFKLDDETFEVKTDSDTGHCLHGGALNFEIKQWHYTVINDENEASVIFYQTSPDVENGFPETLDVEAWYTLTSDDTWRVTVQGVSDRRIVFNPTDHVYFDLAGDSAQSTDEHILWLNSRLFATLNKDTTPTGEVVSVSGTTFDFRRPKKLDEVFVSDFRQSMIMGGIDYPFLLKKRSDLLNTAELTSLDEKISIQIKTDASEIVIFTTNFEEDGPEMRGNESVDHGGIASGTQELPGAGRPESFGDVTLEPDQVREFITECKINIGK